MEQRDTGAEEDGAEADDGAMFTLTKQCRADEYDRDHQDLID